MSECVSCWLYSLVDALENFGITCDRKGRTISNFPTHVEVNTANRKHTPHNILGFLALSVNFHYPGLFISDYFIKISKHVLGFVFREQ